MTWRSSRRVHEHDQPGLARRRFFAQAFVDEGPWLSEAAAMSAAVRRWLSAREVR